MSTVPKLKSTDAEPPMTVKELDREIIEKLRDMEDGNRTTVREIGRLALQLKALIPGGVKGWDRHCREALGYVGQTVDRYIKIYREEERLQRRFEKQAHAGPEFAPRPNYSKVVGAIKGEIPRYDRMKAEERKEISRLDERALQRKLGNQIIDIGYKALAVQFHPDKGGDARMMGVLTDVRDRLRRCLK